MSLFNISYTIDTDTNTITNHKVVEVAKAIEKAKAKAAPAQKVAAAVSLTASGLQITQEVVDALGAEVGDKVVVEIKEGKPTLVVGSKGNVISKKLTITCKGDKYDSIKAIGGEFTYVKKDDTLILMSIEDKIDEEIPATEVVGFADEVDETVVEQLGDSLDDFDFDFEF